MGRLEDLTVGASVRGLAADGPATVVSVSWFGTNAVEVTYKDSAGRVGQGLLYRDQEPLLEIAEVGRPWSFDGDGRLFRLVSEAYRIRLAHLFDPLLAVHTSLVEPLPHQITAVSLCSPALRLPIPLFLAPSRFHPPARAGGSTTTRATIKVAPTTGSPRKEPSLPRCRGVPI